MRYSGLGGQGEVNFVRIFCRLSRDGNFFAGLQWITNALVALRINDAILICKLCFTAQLAVWL